MRKIDLIVLHCTATPPDMHVHVCDVRKWHIDKGYDDIGYHYLINRAGVVEKGRIDSKTGAHALGYNSHSLGIALAGGVTRNGKSENNFTTAQFNALDVLLKELYKKYGILKTIGHNEISEKDCPCFNVKEFLKGV